MPKKKPPRLLIFLDTNVLFTKVASDLVNNNVCNLIRDNSNHADLHISWHLPQVVVDERRYQMMLHAQDLLPNLQKMEKLLGHSFGVKEDTLNLHIDDAIKKHIKELSIETASLDTKKVDWEDIIERATYRYPPFERGDKEKGFRDAMIANTFLQTHETCPSTPNVCRFAFVTNDKCLSSYVEDKANSAKNIKALESLEELESFINTLVSKISEEFAAELGTKASKLFFVKEDDKTLYYRDNIRDRINKEFAPIFQKELLSGSLRKGGTWWLTEPIFVKKAGQRVHWISMVEPEFELYHYEDPIQPSKQNFDLPNFSGLGLETRNQSWGALSGTNSIKGSRSRLSGGLLGAFRLGEEVIDGKGRERFEVHWSASLTQAKNLTRPSIDGIEYVGHNLEDEP